MRKKANVLVMTKPLTVTVAILPSPGTTRQIYDNSTGVYSPDRTRTATWLAMVGTYTNPNTGTTGNIQWTSVEWYEVTGTGTKTRITSGSNGYSLSGNSLLVQKNIPESQSGTVIIGVGHYTNPSTGASQIIDASETLTTAVSAVSALSLNIEPVAGNTTYAGRVCLINPLVTPLNQTTPTNWKRKCRVQLRDGTVALADAHTIGSAADAARTGNAFYFWYYRQNGQLVRLLENNDWFEAEYYADGTMSREVTVDLAKIRDVELVCKAGYIPYGELADYINGDGIIQPSKCYLGYLQESFKLRVALPVVQRDEVVSLSHPVLNISDLGDSSVQIIRRLLLTCGGSVVNDLTLGSTPPWPDTVFDTLFDVTWYACFGGESVAIGTGEFLVINGSELLTALQTLTGFTTSNLKGINFEVEYEPKYPLLTGNNYVEGYTLGSSDIVPVKKIGNKGWLNSLNFYLLDTTDNDQEDTEPLLLRRDNLLRFAGGGYAPVVHISAAQAADADLELFRKNGSGNYLQYCSAGAYNAEDYVSSVLRPWYAGTLSGWQSPQLYKSDGNGGWVEAHAVLPWESTETKYTIGIGFSQGLYLLDNVQGSSGTVWKGLFTDVTEWDGIDLTPYYLAPTAISPCPVATVTEGGLHKTRNLFFLTAGETNCKGMAGQNNVSQMFKQGGRTYPRVSDVTAISNMNYARNNNANVNSPVPFGEGGYHARNTLITALELLYSRKNPFRASQFGSGISSNDSCSSLTEWRENGGIRARVHGNGAFTYYKWDSNTPFYYNTSGKRSNFSDVLNQYGPKEQCMESQLAASFAVEFGIAATTDVSSPVWFEMYGGRYYYMNVTDAKTLAQGYMNVRVYKELTETVSAWDASGNAVQYDVEVLLRMSLFGGANLSGDIFEYCQGGCECIGKCEVEQETSRSGNTYDVYLITDQRHWKRETDTTHDSELFQIEQNEYFRGRFTQVGNGYAKKRQSYTPVKTENGGSLSSYECFYGYTDNYWQNTVGRRTRVGLRFRGSASYGCCSPRSWHGCYSAAAPSSAYAGSAQARIRKRS